MLSAGRARWEFLSGEQPWVLARRVLEVGRSGVPGVPPCCSSPPCVVQEANLEKVQLALKAKCSPSELDSLGAQLLADIIADCRYFCEPFHAVYCKSAYLSWKGRLLLFNFFF